MISNSGMTYADNTDVKVVAVIENYLNSGKRLRVFYGDNATGEDWGEENNVIGYICKSTGRVKVPLLVYNNTSAYGHSLLCNSIVKIMDVESKRALYQHPNYHQPAYSVSTTLPDLAIDGYFVSVYGNGLNVANFKSQKHASHWIDFMTGKRMCK